MKKIIQYGLYALMACSFIDVHALYEYAINGFQSYGNFMLDFRRYETAEDYIKQIHECNDLCQRGAVKRIKIYIDGGAYVRLLAQNLQLPDGIVVDIAIESLYYRTVDVTSALLNDIRGALRNIDTLYIRDAKLEDGVALCNLLKECGVKRLILNSVNSSKILSDAENVGTLLSQTTIEYFENRDCRSVFDTSLAATAKARFWVTHLPTTIRVLRQDIDRILVPYEEQCEILRTALERYPNMVTFYAGPCGLRLDLRTMAYMALHPFIEDDCFSIKEDLKRAIRETNVHAGGNAIPHAETVALANVLMAFRKYRKILNKPYDHVGLLVDTLTKIQDLRVGLPPVDDRCFVKAASQFRKRVEKEYGHFAKRFGQVNEKTPPDEIVRINNEFRQLIKREIQFLLLCIIQQSEDKIQQLLSNAEAGLQQLPPNDEEDDDVDMEEAKWQLFI